MYNTFCLFETAVLKEATICDATVIFRFWYSTFSRIPTRRMRLDGRHVDIALHVRFS